MSQQTEIQEPVLNPETGQIDLPDESTPRIVNGGAPKQRRSWDVTDNRGYTGRFKYEGATVYIRLLTDDDWAELEEIEEGLQDASDAAQEMGAELERQAKLDNDDDDKLSGTQLRELRKSYREMTKGIANRTVAFQHNVLKKTVVGWKDAPVPYSPDALGRLPLEMVASWAQTVLQKSKLGASEADF